MMLYRKGSVTMGSGKVPINFHIVSYRNIYLKPTAWIFIKQFYQKCEAFPGTYVKRSLIKSVSAKELIFKFLGLIF